MTRELWIDIDNYENVYQVSNFGRVRRIGRAKGAVVPSIVKPKTINGRYLRVGLSLNGKIEYRLVHLLVLEHFVGPAPDGCEGDHKDGNTLNARLDNLQWLPIPINRAQGNERRQTR